MTPPLIPRKVLFGNATRLGPVVSPSGDRVAFLAPVDGVYNIWSGPPGDAAPATAERDRPILSIAWAHDDRHLVYLHDDGDENTHLYIVNPADGTARDLTPFPGVQARVIKFDTSRTGAALIGLNRRDPRLHDAYRVDLRTGELDLVAHNDGFVRWIADGALDIRGATRTADDGGTELLVRDDDAAPWRVLHRGPHEDTAGDRPIGFTADGTGLYLLTSLDAETARLVHTDTRTGARTVIYADPEYDVVGVALDPLTRRPQMATVDRERTHLVPLAPDVAPDIERLTAQRRGDVSLINRDRADRVWLVQDNTDDAPAGYYLYDRTTGTTRYLFSHLPELEGLPLARMEPFTFTARDGLTLHGYLSFPPGSPRHAMPAVLTVHGGPWARDRWGFRSEPQWLANRGYLCVQVNYRGSTGYGKAFLNAGDREWGARMQDDLVDAVRWVVDRGYADPARVAVYGASYGGYAALLAATTTPELFRCAISMAGPTDLRTFVSAVPGYWSPQASRLHRRIGHPETDADMLWSRSPLAHVDGLRIPVLIAHGARDPRVRQAEAEQVVEAMRGRGIPYEYLLFDDEGHGLVKRPNRLAFYAAAERFLARHLGGRSEPPDDGQAPS